MLTYSFSAAEAEQAHKDWQCNCGPTALAFALQCSLEEVRPLLPGFSEKRYTNPTMMRHALGLAGRKFAALSTNRVMDDNPWGAGAFDVEPTLIRVQWTGRWTEEGANPKWAYRYTHWICTFEQDGPMVFDGWKADKRLHNSDLKAYVESQHLRG